MGKPGRKTAVSGEIDCVATNRAIDLAWRRPRAVNERDEAARAGLARRLRAYSMTMGVPNWSNQYGPMCA